jgi:anti-anti-sigma factor
MAAFDIDSDGARTFFLSGELDLATVPTMESAIAHAVAQGGPITLDLSQLRFVDSTGIAAITKALKSLPSGCIILHGVHDGIEKVISLMGIEKAPNLHVIACSVAI